MLNQDLIKTCVGSFHGFPDDASNMSMNIRMYVNTKRKNKKKLQQMLCWRLTFLSSQENGF